MVKQLRITLVGKRNLEAMVTLCRGVGWSASAKVQVDGHLVEHATIDHASERDALCDVAEWLRTRFAASTTCLGSTVTIVGVSTARNAA